MSSTCPCQHESNLCFPCPQIQENWMCCDLISTSFSEIINHIKENHILYASKAQVDAQISSGNSLRSMWKFKCQICGEKHWRLDDTITFFVDAHVVHEFLCLKCQQHFHFPTIYEHASICHSKSVNNE